MIEVDYRGIWLDFCELDKLEDVVFEDDAHAGFLCIFGP
jgi:Zn-finger nucleic acid-binding protein